jgi:hypothetical protein
MCRNRASFSSTSKPAPPQRYVWGLFDINVALNQIVDPGGTLCFGAKFQGERKMHFYSDWEHGHQGMVEAAHGCFRGRRDHNLQRGQVRPSQAARRVPACRTAAAITADIDRRLQGGQEAGAAVQQAGVRGAAANRRGQAEARRHGALDSRYRGVPQGPAEDAALLLAGRAAARESL